jgi:hypothetical protein
MHLRKLQTKKNEKTLKRYIMHTHMGPKKKRETDSRKNITQHIKMGIH